MKEGKSFFLKMMVFVFFAVNCMALKAQTTMEFPYFEGFEDPDLDDTWTFLNGEHINKWHIGNATSHDGERSLYVSGDGGKTTNYENATCGIGVYKSFYLPPGNTYEISFDWKVQGEGSTSGSPLDSLFVFSVVDKELKINSSAGEIPSTLAIYRKRLNKNDDLQGAELWHHCTFNQIGLTDSIKLVFYWINNSTNNYPPAGCIDNIQISLKGVSCEKPQNFSATYNGGARLEWTGNSSFYQIRYKNELTGIWTDVDRQIGGSPYTITGLDKGIFTFWVRGVCGTDTTAWAVASNFLVAVSMDKCINFVDLKNPNVVTAKYGRKYESANTNDGLMDFGSLSEDSQHTIHYQQNEIDPRTIDKYTGRGGLKTIPYGELASVRLGNWTAYSEAESLTYSFVVDEANPILILKYAVVLQNNNHTIYDRFDQPRFILRVTDNTGKPLDNTCTTVEFLAGDLPGWNKIQVEGYHSFVIWKDWTTLGINLENYIGRRVNVYVETGDCTPAPTIGCFGYGYFTLGCAANKLSGLTCGSANRELMDTIYAPEGFKYEWYRITDPYTILNEKQYLVPEPTDTSTWICRMIFNERGKEDCDFKLVAALLPRDPVADFSYIACRKEVQFFDESYVNTQNGKTGDQCDVYWHFDDRDSISYERNPIYEFSTPGTHRVTLTASITGGDMVCTHDTVFEITVSEDTITEITREMICHKEYYMFGGRAISKAGVYSDTLMTNYGCDSISILYLDIHDTFAYDTICGGQKYVFEGEELLLEEGLRELVYKNVKSVTGCDSIMMLFIASIVSFDSDAGVCADEEYLQINVTAGIDSVQIRFSNESAARGYVDNTAKVSNNSFRFILPENAYAGACTGTFILYSSYCGISYLDFSFDIRYPSEIIAQRWNDVLAIKSKNFNGGYNFIGYQWYRNGEKMDGETKSYLFVPEGLNPEDEYYAELIREDNVVMSTCEYKPENLDADLTLVDNKAQVNQAYTIKSSKEGTVRLYSLTGSLISEHKLSSGTNQIKAPSTVGYYLLQVKTEEQEKTYYLNVTQ